ncbi:hypothetical protein KKE38_03460 [Candidatus Micrarchaeota archaeon]|nr:hypothetical protein [Candidatus Micrarchaeota archaeon]
MVDLKKLRAKKKEYHFDIKHKYEYTGHYKMIERPPIEKIKDAIKSFTAPKKDKKKAEKKQLSSSRPPGGFNFAILGAALLVALIILGIGFLYFSSLLQAEAYAFNVQTDKPEIFNTILGGEILSSGESGDSLYTGAAFIDYNTENLDTYNITLTPYQEHIPSEIFILNSKKIEATTYSDFISTLRSNLSKRNVILNEISISDLETLPQGAVVLVPTGVIPKELIGMDSLITINKLVDRGIVIIYMGQPFTKVLDGSLVVSLSDSQVRSLPFTFDQSEKPESSDGFNLFDARYRVSSSVGWKSTLKYGSVSVVRKNNGAFVFLPQTLDGGWRSNGAVAATDVARIIYEIPWATELEEPNTYEFTDPLDHNGSRYFFTNPFDATKGTIKVDFVGNSTLSNNPIIETLYIYLEKNDDNELFIKEGIKVVPTNITGERTRVTASLKEDTAASPDMFLIINDINATQVQMFPQGYVNVQSDSFFDIPVYVQRGEYIIELIDDESKKYAQSYMKVVGIDIEYKGISPDKSSVYLFDITMDDNPSTLGEVEIKVDDGEYGTYNFNNVNSIQLDLGSRTSDQNLPFGNHTFTFTSGSLVIEVPISHTKRSTIFDNPLFWLVVILTGGIVGLGIFFARQEAVYFAIDIPDFPPVARTRIPLSPDVVLSIFQKVNENYRWETTPLSPSEIKNGFKSIFYKGRPIFITDYNVEYLLEDLRKKGLVDGALGYFGLSSWKSKTGHTLQYLSIMRSLRDICVNNAVPFTGLNESEAADSVITVVGQQMYLHFFDKEGDVESMFHRVLTSIKRGITIVIFKNEFEKQEFVTLLNSSSSVAPLIMKMESDSKALLFNTTEELEDMIAEFKNV